MVYQLYVAYCIVLLYLVTLRVAGDGVPAICCVLYCTAVPGHTESGNDVPAICCVLYFTAVPDHPESCW